MVPASLGPSASSSGIEQAMRLTPDGERIGAAARQDQRGRAGRAAAGAARRV